MNFACAPLCTAWSGFVLKEIAGFVFPTRLLIGFRLSAGKLRRIEGKLPGCISGGRAPIALLDYRTRPDPYLVLHFAFRDGHQNARAAARSIRWVVGGSPP
jgi:hypothetical protein